MDTIKEFQGEYRWLSNFWPCPIEMPDGIVYPSAEHAYQAMKTLHMPLRIEVSMIEKPGSVKRWARTVPLRPGWESMKIEIMREVVTRKFQQNQHLAEKLLTTSDTELEEGNYWGDRFWGISPAGTLNGRNELGKILMAVRQQLREQRQ